MTPPPKKATTFYSNTTRISLLTSGSQEFNVLRQVQNQAPPSFSQKRPVIKAQRKFQQSVQVREEIPKEIVSSPNTPASIILKNDKKDRVEEDTSMADLSQYQASPLPQKLSLEQVSLVINSPVQLQEEVLEEIPTFTPIILQNFRQESAVEDVSMVDLTKSLSLESEESSQSNPAATVIEQKPIHYEEEAVLNIYNKSPVHSIKNHTSSINERLRVQHENTQPSPQLRMIQNITKESLQENEDLPQPVKQFAPPFCLLQNIQQESADSSFVGQSRSSKKDSHQGRRTPSPTRENWNQESNFGVNFNHLPPARHLIRGSLSKQLPAQVPLPPPGLFIPQIGACRVPSSVTTPLASRGSWNGKKGPKTPPPPPPCAAPQKAPDFDPKIFLNPLLLWGTEGMKDIVEKKDGEERLRQMYLKKNLSLEQIKEIRAKTMKQIVLLHAEIEKRLIMGEVVEPQEMNPIEMWKTMEEILKDQ